MAKIQVADVHDLLLKAGIPVDGVATAKGDQIDRIDFGADATEAQQKEAWALVAGYDAEAAAIEREAKAAEQRAALETKVEISDANSIAALRAIIEKQQAQIDALIATRKG